MSGAGREPGGGVGDAAERGRVADERDRTADVRDERADTRERALDSREAALDAHAAASRERRMQAARTAHDRVEMARLAVEASEDLLRAAQGELSRTAATAARAETRDRREQADVDRQRRP